MEEENIKCKFEYGICDACECEDMIELVYLDEELKEAKWLCRNCIIKATTPLK